jgi:hypothetical protein
MNMARWSPLYFVVVALIAMAPVAAFAGRKDDDSRRSGRGSSHSIVLKKDDVYSYSVWATHFSFGSSKHTKKLKKSHDFRRYTHRLKPYCPPSEAPIPEPSAALLFAAGAGVVAHRLRGIRR